MKATSSHNFLIFCVLSYFFVFSSTSPCVAGEMPTSSSHLDASESEQTRRNRHTKRSLHKPLTKRQTEDQNLQFMLSLYSRAADTDGRPKEHKLFGSNTVRLLRASATEKSFQAAAKDLQYTYTVEFDLESLPLHKLVRASFVHLRSPLGSQTPMSCEARVSTPGRTAGETGVPSDRWAILGPRHQWTESDVTDRVVQWKGGRLSLTAQYRCAEAGHARSRGRRGTSGRCSTHRSHLRAPALLLFLEEEAGQPMERAGWQPMEPRPPTPRPHPRRSRNAGSIASDIPNFKRGKSGVAKNQCKLHSYRVEFRDLGWGDWIIAPHMYNPHYCMGDCPRILYYGYNSPNHAIVQTFISELGLGEIPPPACVPHKYKPISVLMIEKNGSIVYKEYQDMIAESCTCR